MVRLATQASTQPVAATAAAPVGACYTHGVFIVIQGQPRSGDTMVLDSAAGHQRTFDSLAAFLASPQASIEIAAAGTCHLCPTTRPLRAFRMVKTGGKLRTEELPDGVLQVSGRPDLLARYIEAFRFEPGAQDHHHPEQQEIFFSSGLDPRSASIIIEADDYAAEPDRWAADNRE